MKKLVIAILLTTLLLTAISCGVKNPSGETPTETETEASANIDTDGEITAQDTEETTSGEATAVPSEVALNEIYPMPAEVKKADGVAVLPLAVEEDSAHFATLARLGLTSDGKSGIPLTVELADLSAEFSTGADEGYILEITPNAVKIKAQTDAGVHYAIVTLGQLVTDGKYLPAALVKDAPTVPIRGVIEGFYGQAWSGEFRLELMERMGDMKMNAYIYAPKDDLKHRSMWRDLYAKREINALTELVNAAKANSVRFIYAISPGNDINLGSGYSSDFKALTKKCQQLYDIGVRDFAILLDDIPVLDAQGHAKLLNDFNNKFVKTHEGCSQMIAITPEYTDSFLTKYTDEIAPLLDKDITMMWTGPGVVYPTITNKSLEKINTTYGSRVFIWWNYPVNDVQVEHLYLDACRGFDTDIYTSISGLVSNPMNQGEASLIPIFTTADFLWNPTAYNPDKSLSAAVNIIDPSLHDELVLFADAVGASPMNNWTSTAILRDLLKQYDFDKFDADLNAKLIAAAEKLSAVGKIKNSTNAAFVTETYNWIEKTEAYANMALEYFKMENAYHEGDKNAAAVCIGEYAKWSAIAEKTNVLTSQDVLAPFVAQFGQRVNRLAGISGEIKCHSATGFTNLNTYENYKISNICDGDDASYFWSAGAPGTGYVGIDLGERVTLENVYILTGENGGDVFSSAVIEYSLDKVHWTELAEGGFGAEIFLDGIGAEARYIRMRGTDTSSSTWAKVRVFEANTTRTPLSGVGEYSVSTSFSTYQSYSIENISDKNKNTYFWSSRNVETGDYVLIDLGILSEISSVYLNTGVSGHTSDFMPGAELTASADGYRWEKLASVKQGAQTFDNLNVRARYVKLTATQPGNNWFTMSDFDVDHTQIADARIKADGVATALELARACDGNAATVLNVNAPGKTLEFDISGANQVRIIAPATGDGTVCELLNPDGGVISSVNLENDTEIQCSDAAKISIKFGSGEIAIADIVTK